MSDADRVKWIKDITHSLEPVPAVALIMETLKHDEYVKANKMSEGKEYVTRTIGEMISKQIDESLDVGPLAAKPIFPERRCDEAWSGKSNHPSHVYLVGLTKHYCHGNPRPDLPQDRGVSGQPFSGAQAQVEEDRATDQQLRDFLKNRPSAGMAAPTKQREGDQVLPTKNTGTPIQHLVMQDIITRMDVGYKRYGTYLQANNGRNSLQDLYEELLDACIYTRQLLEEKNAPV